MSALGGEAGRKELAMAEARQALDTAYSWLEDRLKDRAWAAVRSLAWRIAPPLPRYSTPTGSTRFRPGSHARGNIGPSCWLGRRSPGPWRKGVRIAPTSRSALLIETKQKG